MSEDEEYQRANLADIEDKLVEMFNARHNKGKDVWGGEHCAEHAKAAAKCAEMILQVRQQRQFEDGETNIVTSNPQQSVRRYVKKNK